jgi:hypothetical protein
MISLREARS